MTRHFLHPGAVRFSASPELVETILGSCVSITLRDPVSGLTAISHCVLPNSPAGVDEGLAVELQPPHLGMVVALDLVRAHADLDRQAAGHVRRQILGSVPAAWAGPATIVVTARV